MKRLKLFAYITILSSLVYSAAWCFVSFSIYSYLNSNFAGKIHAIKGFGEEDYKISFASVKPSGFPFKFGVKFYGLTEESLSAIITHSEPLYVGYDIIHRGFFSQYDGISVARPKPLHTGFGTELTGSYSNYIAYPLHKLLTGKIDLNFVGVIKANTKNLQARDITDKSLLYNAEYFAMRLEVPNRPYYLDLAHVKKDPPPHYYLTLKDKVDNVVEGRRIAPASLVYGLLLGHALECDIDLELRGKAEKQGGLKDFIKNIELKSNKLHYSDDAVDFDGKLYLISKSTDDGIDAKLQCSSLEYPKENYIKRLVDRYQKLATNILEANNNTILMKPFLDQFLHDPNRYFPASISAKKLESTLDIGLQINDKGIAAKVYDVSFFADSAGFKITGDGSLGKNTKIAGTISLYQYSDMVDFAASYSRRVLGGEPSGDLLKLDKQVSKDFLRMISNHPESEAADIVLSYEFKDNLTSSNIGSHSINDVIALYYNILYTKAIAIAKESGDFNGKLKEIAPGLAANPTLLKSLMMPQNP